MTRWRLGACALAIVGSVIGFATPADASGGTFFQYTTPTTPASPSYTGITCVIDLSSIPEYSFVSSVTGCGVTVTFSSPMEKLVIGSGWNAGSWGYAGNVESPASPNGLLFSYYSDSVTLTYHTATPGGAGRRTVGVEATPNLEENADSITATFTGAGNVLDGSFTRSITDTGDTCCGGDGNFNAMLFAARTKTVPKVSTLTLTDNNGEGYGFAIAQIRV